VFLEFNHAAYPKGTWYQRDKKYWDLLHARNDMRNSNQILHSDQTIREEEILEG